MVPLRPAGLSGLRSTEAEDQGREAMTPYTIDLLKSLIGKA